MQSCLIQTGFNILKHLSLESVFMGQYIQSFYHTFLNTLIWVWHSITLSVPWYQNYFWGLVVISLAVWMLEITFPWRKGQAIFRNDFWLDCAYMFFNFFVFAVIISGFYQVLSEVFSQVGVTPGRFALIDIASWPMAVQLLVFFIVLDFFQWFTHLLLHRVPWFWQYHKVHHSVKQMGFAAHLRYHWMENVLYKPLKVLGVMLLGGFEPEQAYIVHFLAITIGHINHANIKITWGPFKYLLNNPVMHLYHHAYTLPKGSHGVNFGISLSLWDYLFKTNYIPEDSGKVKLGFEGDEQFPKGFMGQQAYGFGKHKAS